MSLPSIRISPSDICAYARICGIEVAEQELVIIADQLSRLHDELRELWDVDVSADEMAVIFPIQPA